MSTVSELDWRAGPRAGRITGLQFGYSGKRPRAPHPRSAARERVRRVQRRCGARRHASFCVQRKRRDHRRRAARRREARREAGGNAAGNADRRERPLSRGRAHRARHAGAVRGHRVPARRDQRRRRRPRGVQRRRCRKPASPVARHARRRESASPAPFAPATRPPAGSTTRGFRSSRPRAVTCYDENIADAVRSRDRIAGRRPRQRIGRDRSARGDPQTRWQARRSRARSRAVALRAGRRRGSPARSTPTSAKRARRSRATCRSRGSPSHSPRPTRIGVSMSSAARRGRAAALPPAMGASRWTLPRAFDVSLALQRFDPSRFAAVPGGSLNGTVKATGVLLPEWRTTADVSSRTGSRYAGATCQVRARNGHAAHARQCLDRRSPRARAAQRERQRGCGRRQADVHARRCRASPSSRRCCGSARRRRSRAAYSASGTLLAEPGGIGADIDMRAQDFARAPTSRSTRSRSRRSSRRAGQGAARCRSNARKLSLTATATRIAIRDYALDSVGVDAERHARGAYRHAWREGRIPERDGSLRGRISLARRRPATLGRLALDRPRALARQPRRRAAVAAPRRRRSSSVAPMRGSRRRASPSPTAGSTSKSWRGSTAAYRRAAHSTRCRSRRWPSSPDARFRSCPPSRSPATGRSPRCRDCPDRSSCDGSRATCGACKADVRKTRIWRSASKRSSSRGRSPTTRSTRSSRFARRERDARRERSSSAPWKARRRASSPPMRRSPPRSTPSSRRLRRCSHGSEPRR